VRIPRPGSADAGGISRLREIRYDHIDRISLVESLSGFFNGGVVAACSMSLPSSWHGILCRALCH